MSTKKTCTRMFTEALFIIAKTWKLPRWPSVSEWTNKPWYIQKIKYFSIFIEKYYTKKWAISAYKWNLKCILLNERSQSEKATYYMIPTIWHSGKGKTIETLKKKSVVARGFGEGLASEAQVIFRAVKILCVILLI